jgi:sulfate transport system substrate-binding protein
LVVYAFSTQEEILTQGIFPAFEQSWEAVNERELKIEGVFGPSGVLAGEINLGAPAHVALFSNLRHVNWLKLGKRLQADAEPMMYASTSLVIVTRPGNPVGISEFTDLAQPGIQLLHADPRSSGVGEWAVLAEYGSAYQENGNQQAAEAQLKDIWKNVRLLGDSARATLTLFELGVGDALVTYEQDALLAQKRGVPIEIITPQRTILTRHFAVMIDDNLTAAEQQVSQAFLDFLLSNEGQQILSKYDLHPVVSEYDVIAQEQKTFTEEDLGGWAWAYQALIENLWEREIAPNLKLESASTLLKAGD